MVDKRGGWADQCSATDPGAVQPARDGRVRHSYPYRSAPQARSHAVRPLPQDGPRGLPHHVSREAAVFEVMLTRGYSGIRAGTFIIPIPGAIASDESAPSVRSSAQRSSTTMSLSSWPLVRGTSRSKVTDAHRQRLRRAVRFRCRWRPIPNFTRPRTRSSNPVPSSGESTNFRFLSRRRPLFGRMMKPCFLSSLRISRSDCRGCLARLPRHRGPDGDRSDRLLDDRLRWWLAARVSVRTRGRGPVAWTSTRPCSG